MPKPKYQIGDEVWVIMGLKAVKRKVIAVGLLYADKRGYFRYALDRYDSNDYLAWGENDLFPTKEELLASL